MGFQVAKQKIISSRTRDVNSLNVYKDSKSGVIFIDDFYVGDSTYEDGQYRPSNNEERFEAQKDCKRRSEAFTQFYVGLDILDFGCGAGDFLYSVADHCASVAGIELQKSYVEKLNAEGIECHNSLINVEVDVLAKYVERLLNKGDK